MSAPATEFPTEVAQEFAEGFVANYFGEVDLGHESRNRCFARVAEQISRHPGGTLHRHCLSAVGTGIRRREPSMSCTSPVPIT